MDAPLRRNADFMLLQFSQLVSSGGSQITAIAYPLLVLSLTGSSAKAGLVAFARLLPSALFALPAGLARRPVEPPPGHNRGTRHSRGRGWNSGPPDRG